MKETFTREEVIKLLDGILFFVSDNGITEGDEAITGRSYLEMRRQ